MKFSLFVHMEKTNSSQSYDQLYNEFLSLCKIADDGGMHAIWTGEHHCMDFTIAPNPFLTISDLANKLKHVRLGTGTIIAPFWHPIKLAGESAMTDLITSGRLELGIARGAYEAALRYSKERVQFGKPISSFQGISFKLAEMATQIEAAELLTQNASQLINQGKKMTKESAICKLFASEACVSIANEAVQIFGGYGYSKEFPVEKFYRDSKLCTIGEGTSEIQKVVIAKQILK